LEGNIKCSGFQRSQQCSLILPVKVGWKQGKALGSKEIKALEFYEQMKETE
jgi:hypothetical protein